MTETVIEAPVVVLAGTLARPRSCCARAGRAPFPSDRAALFGNGDIIAFGYGEDVSGVGVGHPPKVEGLEIARRSQDNWVRDADVLASSSTCRRARCRPVRVGLPVLFLPNGRLLGAISSLVNGVYEGRSQPADVRGLARQRGRARFSLEDDQLALAWAGAKDEPVYARLDAILSRLVSASGGKYVKNPLAGTIMGHQPATAHPLGGCGMGQDRSDGVVDHKCHVFDGASEPGTPPSTTLYVIDGAVIRARSASTRCTIGAFERHAALCAGPGLRYNGTVSPRPRPHRPDIELMRIEYHR